MPEWPSKSAVERAGKRVRGHFRDRASMSDDDYEDCLATIDAHRRSHYGPMGQANVSLRGFCDRLGIEYRVTQRLKRMETILEKLTDRFPGMNLARMQDYGGCRVVVSSEQDLRRLHERVEKAGTNARTYDYVAEPQPSGYRAIHVVRAYGQTLRRTIEIQLRTEHMQDWADTVEYVSGILNINYKQNGDAEFQRWMRAVSLILQHDERGTRIPEDVHDEYVRTWGLMLERMRTLRTERERQ